MPEFSNALMWFRRDLRTRDQSALYHALQDAKQNGWRIHCLFVFDETILADLPSHDRRVAFIHGSVAALQKSLREAGGRLWIGKGDPRALVPAFAEALDAQALYFNHDYEPDACARDEQIRQLLTKKGTEVRSFKDQAIFEKDEVLTGAGKPYSVYTPYKRAWLQAANGDQAFKAYPSIRHLDQLAPHRGASAQTPKIPRSAGTLYSAHTDMPSLDELGFGKARDIPAPIAPGEDAALTLLEKFEPRVGKYDQTRDFPALASTSTLSVHLRHGTISVRALARLAYANAQTAADRTGAQTWLSELIWRDFFFQILYHHPRQVKDGKRLSFKPEYDKIKWESGKQADEHFAAWCEGRTGYPLVDAAMRQINQTGFMHNRVRMVVATFLCKDLGVDWRRGEAYFEEQLNDFELSSNNSNWQWASSSGCDAQPWFRIFNPVTQSEKFDAKGEFIRRYVPELAGLDNKTIHAPWTARPEQLAKANLNLGREYPRPIVDHAEARLRTLERYDVVKSARLQGETGTVAAKNAKKKPGQLGLALDDD